MTNTRKLKALFIENNLTNKDIAELLNISKYSLSLKINNKRDFKASEILKLSNHLKLSPIDVVSIFFAINVELYSTQQG